MAEASKKHCTNPACSMRDIDITTDKDDCLGCGSTLFSDTSLADSFGRLFGAKNDNPFGDLFGRTPPPPPKR